MHLDIIFLHGSRVAPFFFFACCVCMFSLFEAKLKCCPEVEIIEKVLFLSSLQRAR